MPTDSKTKVLLNKLMWTVIQSVGGSLSGAAIFGVAAWKAAALAGCTSAIAYLTLEARRRLEPTPAGP